MFEKCENGYYTNLKLYVHEFEEFTSIKNKYFITGLIFTETGQHLF